MFEYDMDPVIWGNIQSEHDLVDRQAKWKSFIYIVAA